MRTRGTLWPALGLPVVLGFLLALPLEVAAQETGTVEGTVVDEETGEALVGVSLSVEGTGLGSLTGSDGTFEIENVPEGEYELRAEVIGYESQAQDVEVVADETVTVEFVMPPAVIDVEAIVAVGVTEATERARVPFSVGRTTEDIMEVTTPSAAQALSGQVAGVNVVQGTGAPGSAPDIIMRGATSIDAAGRDQGPLIVVDGVIQGDDLSDIDALDIEDMQVVRGAAATSLYGSRASQGVLQITTRDGSRLDDDQVRYTFSAEYGRQSLENEFNLAQRHYFDMTELDDGTRVFLDAGGEPCGFPGTPEADAAGRSCPNFSLAGQRAEAGESPNLFNSFLTEDYPQVYDNVDAVFDPGNWLQSNLAVEGRSGGTNYRVSYSNLQESGVVDDLSGYQRHNFRIRLNQAITENLNVAATAFTSRSSRDDMPDFSGNPMFSLTRMPAGVDITQPDPNTPELRGQLVPIRRPHPGFENENPLIELRFRDIDQDRSRTQAAADVSYTPQPWLSLDGNVSYDRRDSELADFVDIGYPEGRSTGWADGALGQVASHTEALNTSVDVTGRWSVGDLDTRLQGRYLYEEQVDEFQDVDGTNLSAVGVPALGNLEDMSQVDVSSAREVIRSEGLFAGLNLDFRDRYIFDGLFRRDGSSLFGADQRWQNYFRAAGAYRLSEEEFFDVEGIDQLTLRAAVGTAGGRPNFEAQYETFSVGAGVVSPQTLGNRDLRPEKALEQEYGMEVLALGRYSAEVTYARTEVEDQIMRVPLPSTTGFTQQWQNAGTVRSNTLEVTLDAQLVQREAWDWRGRLMFDRTRQRVSELDVPAFTMGVGGQNMGDIFYIREGGELGTFYGGVLAESCGQLPSEVRDACDTHFDVNDDGYVVPVGEGSDWRGMQWGETVEINGQEFDWGLPVGGVDIDPITGEETEFAPVGNTTPDFNLSFSSTLTFGNLSLYGLLDWQEGVDVWNQPLQWATFQHFSGIMDETGVPEEEQKPVGYYDHLYQSFGLQPTNAWVHDASFVKLRELALRYSLGADRVQALPGLGAVENIALRVTGRNLLTFTDYDGYDPEIGRTGGDVGSGALARVDGFQYPNYRTISLGVEVSF